MEKSLLSAKGSERILLLESLSHQLENSNVFRASSLAKEALILTRKENDKLKEEELFGWLGYLFRLQNIYDSSSFYFINAIVLAQERDNANAKAEYLNGLCQLERSQGKLSIAINHAVEALKLSEQEDNLKQTGEAFYNIGYIHLIQRSFDSALLYFRKSLTTRRQTGDSSLVAGSYNGIGLVFMRTDDYDESRKWFMNASALIDSISNPRLLAMIYNNTGVTYENQGEYAEGRKFYYRSIALKNKFGDWRGLASTYGNLGDNFRESGNPDEALKYAVLSQKLSIETKSLDYLINSHKLMAYAYELKRDFKNAYEHFQIYHDLEDSLFNSNKARQVNDMLARYQVEKKQEENEKLKASAALTESTLSRQKIIIITAAISLGIVLLVMNFLYNLYTRSKKLAADLAIQKAEAEQMNSQLNLAMQDNLNITNFMVHDLRAPMNKVAGFTNLIQKDGVLNSQQAMYATKLMEVVDQGRKLIDDLLTVNKPQALNIRLFDCNNLLQDTIREYSSIADQKNISISYDLPDGSVILESDEDFVNRVMDNFLSNAIKFSSTGSNVTVTLKEEEITISIAIKDEGPGFTEEDQKSLYQKFKRLSARPTNGEPSTGLGLAIAKNIIDSLGGSISLNTESGKGSTFTVEFPKRFSS